MTIKAGDICWWVTRGVLVTAIKPSVAGEFYMSTTGTSHMLLSASVPGWDVEMLGAPQPAFGGVGLAALLFTVLPVKARNLRPLRDGDAADETLAWKPVPLPQIEGQPA